MDTIGHPKTKWRDLRFKIVATVRHFIFGFVFHSDFSCNLQGYKPSWTLTLVKRNFFSRLRDFKSIFYHHNQKDLTSRSKK